MTIDWDLECSSCGTRAPATGLPTVCPDCSLPWLVRYARPFPAELKETLAGTDMWRYRALMPLAAGESPVSLGEGMTPLLRSLRLAERLGLSDAWIKDEAPNPTGSFKARGLAAAVTRAWLGGATRFVLPTAGNAGVACAAYGARAGAAVRVYAPDTTPQPLLAQMKAYGAEVITISGHIGDCGKLARAHSSETGAFDMSTLREPYRIEGKKTLGLELAEQFGWSLPDAILYPTGGGTGLIGMWKAFLELIDAGWVQGPMPRLYSVQAAGCAPVVKAFEEQSPKTEPWLDPQTVASGLRVPGPLGGALIMRGIRESGGGAIAVTDEELVAGAELLSTLEGVDACPEGGAAVAAVQQLVERGTIKADEKIVIFNTGAGVLYGRDFT